MGLHHTEDWKIGRLVDWKIKSICEDYKYVSDHEYKKYVVACTNKAVYTHKAVHTADVVAYIHKAIYTHKVVYTDL